MSLSLYVALFVSLSFYVSVFVVCVSLSFFAFLFSFSFLIVLISPLIRLSPFFGFPPLMFQMSKWKNSLYVSKENFRF